MALGNQLVLLEYFIPNFLLSSLYFEKAKDSHNPKQRSSSQNINDHG